MASLLQVRCAVEVFNAVPSQDGRVRSNASSQHRPTHREVFISIRTCTKNENEYLLELKINRNFFVGLINVWLRQVTLKCGPEEDIEDQQPGQRSHFSCLLDWLAS